MSAPSRSDLWLIVALACAVVFMLLRAGVVQRRLDSATDAAHAMIVPLASAPSGASANPDSHAGRVSPLSAAAESVPAALVPFVGPLQEPRVTVLHDTLGPDDSIYLSLQDHRVNDARIVEVTAALSGVFDSRTQSRPGDRFELARDTSGAVHRFRYIPRRTPERPVLVERIDGKLAARRLDLPLARELHAVELQIEDNLSHAIAAIGEGDALTDMLADEIFGAMINFRREQRRGDRIGLVFERLLYEGRFVRYGHILAARYSGRVVSQTGVRFTDARGRDAYYDAAGKSLARQFLLYALPYRGITSRFNPKRLHPVLKRIIPHLGTDYAAATGTKAWATGRGRVIHAGWKGSLGKAVIIEHANGYVTRYGHLSRILAKPGQRVEQRQIIGRVGATGRVTGPHLHYEIIKNGKHQDPESINKGTRGEPLEQAELIAFRARRDELLQLLDGVQQRPAPLATGTEPDAGADALSD